MVRKIKIKYFYYYNLQYVLFNIFRRNLFNGMQVFIAIKYHQEADSPFRISPMNFVINR